MGKLLAVITTVVLAAGLAFIVPGIGPATTVHIVGAWANNESGGTELSGGYELWSNGKVVPLEGARYYGSPVGSGLNNFVGMVPDYWSNGYWLVTSSGKIYSYGEVCKEERLTGPRNVPSSGIVGAIDLKDTTNEGFDLVAASGAVFQFQCE